VNLYVQYAKADPITHRAATTPNTGIVDVFNLNGVMLQRLVTNTNLNSPWGVTQAPSGFGSFSGDILVGNFGDGTISVFDPVTGLFLGRSRARTAARSSTAGYGRSISARPAPGSIRIHCSSTRESMAKRTACSRRLR
jgi:uncharacterized protein (TIGR03118 family)